MTKPHHKKRRISPPTTQHTIASSTTINTEHQPLFLPDPDEDHGPSTSARTPLFLPEEVERERPRKKKRRISSKAAHSRTLDDLWHSRQVGGISWICSLVHSLPKKVQSHGRRNSSPSPPGPSNPQPNPPSLSQRPKKRSVQSILGKKLGVFWFTFQMCVVIEVDFTAPSKGKNTAHASSSNAPTTHHIPTSLEVIEISDSDGPNSPEFTGVNQAPVKFSVSLMETGQEIIEIVSSDAEDASQPPHSPIQTSPLADISQMSPERLQQPAPIGGSPDLPDLTPIPPQSSFPVLPQCPQVSSPHEVENMMDIDDASQHSPPLPSPPPPLPVPQVDLSIDVIGRTLSSVTVSPSPTNPTHPPHAPEFVEDSEPDAGPSKGFHDRGTPQTTPTPPVENAIVQSAESDDDFHPPPPPSSSSPSHNVPLSRHPTPTVRHLLYGGPNGIFKDANASIVQHIWATVPQDPISHTPTSPPNPHPDGGLENGLLSALGAVTPPVPTSPHGPTIVQVNGSAALSLTPT